MMFKMSNLTKMTGKKTKTTMKLSLSLWRPMTQTQVINLLKKSKKSMRSRILHQSNSSNRLESSSTAKPLLLLRSQPLSPAKTKKAKEWKKLRLTSMLENNFTKRLMNEKQKKC